MKCWFTKRYDPTHPFSILSSPTNQPTPPKQALAEELAPLYEQGQLDGFNLYVYGIVLKALQPQLLGGGGGNLEGRPRYVFVNARGDAVNVVI